MEPAAMLVRAFEIQVGWPFQIGALFQAKGMGGAGIEPHVENVAHLLPFLGIVVLSEESACRAIGKPSVGPLLRKCFGNPLVYFGIIE